MVDTRGGQPREPVGDGRHTGKLVEMGKAPEYKRMVADFINYVVAAARGEPYVDGASADWQLDQATRFPEEISQLRANAGILLLAVAGEKLVVGEEDALLKAAANVAGSKSEIISQVPPDQLLDIARFTLRQHNVQVPEHVSAKFVKG